MPNFFKFLAKKEEFIEYMPDFVKSKLRNFRLENSIVTVAEFCSLAGTIQWIFASKKKNLMIFVQTLL